MFDDSRWGDDPRDRRDDNWRDCDDEDTLTLGRGPGSSAQDDHSEDDARNRDDDSRGLERDRDSRDREEGLDPRDVFMRDLDLPRGLDREIVHDTRDREYTLRGSESRILSTVGAFRVVSSRDLRDHNDRARTEDARLFPQARQPPLRVSVYVPTQSRAPLSRPLLRAVQSHRRAQ